MTLPSNPESAGARLRKILVVDDDQVIIKTLSFKLRAQGYTVCAATDGSGAVSAVRTEKPDLILLDISFPPDVAHGGGVPWDGFRIITWLRRIDDAREIPVIIISSSDPAQVERRAMEAGAVAFFQKPIDHDKLVEAIRKVLDGDRGAPPRPGSQPDPVKS